MNPWLVALITAPAVGALAGIVLISLHIRSDQHPGPATRHARVERDVRHDVWPRGWTHAAPSVPFTVAEAHREMQRHRGCHTDWCPRKAVAFEVLIAAGRVIPDSSRRRD